MNLDSLILCELNNYLLFIPMEMPSMNIFPKAALMEQ